MPAGRESFTRTGPTSLSSRGGEATILYAGKIEGSHDTGNGEIRGPKMVGGKSQKVTTGDVLVMPPGVPHQTVVDPGKSFFALIVKVQKK